MQRSRFVLFLVSLLVPLTLHAQAILGEQVPVNENERGGKETLLQDQSAKKQPPSAMVEYDQPPEMVKQFQPDYPSEALKEKLEGTVWINMWIDEAGKVVETKVAKSENDVFNNAAKEAAMRWVFKPASAKGKPVAVWVTVPFRFKLYNGAEAPNIGIPMPKPETQGLVKPESAPEPLKRINPKYPGEAKKDRLEGTVWIKIEIDETGKPTKASVLKSDAAVFDQPAIDAAMQWMFKPAMAKGKAVASIVTIPFRFALSEGKQKK